MVLVEARRREETATARWGPFPCASRQIITSDPALPAWGRGGGQVHQGAFWSSKHPYQKLSMINIRLSEFQ